MSWIGRYLKPCLFWALNASAQETNVLSKGDWLKFGVTVNGLYKIDSDFLQKSGWDLATIQPEHIALYGQAAGVLAQANDAPRPADLQQMAIQVDLQPDGTLGTIYFYGEGATTVFFDQSKERFVHETNPYTDTTFYFLTVLDSPGLRIEKENRPTSSSSTLAQSFDAYWYYEKETVNLLKSGRSWWGDYLGTTPALAIEVPLSGLMPEEDALLDFAAIASAQTTTKFTWQVNGATVGQQTAGIVSTYRYDLKAQLAKGTYHFLTPAESNEKLRLNLSYDKNGQNSATAYLDYVSLQTKRRLRPYTQPTIYLFSPDRSHHRTASFSEVNAPFILWDVSNPLSPIELTRQETDQGKTWEIPLNPQRSHTYLGFEKNQAVLPHTARRIRNQQIRTLPTPDLLIITAPDWRTEAERLAAFRESHDNLEVQTVLIEEVYNEFSFGRPDVTAIRDLCKYFYDREPGKLKYLLLFGDASFDYRNKRASATDEQQRNWIPSYQSRESLHPVYTYASDDYFALLDASAGEWNEDATGDHSLRIGVGRLPVKNQNEAKLMVDKLIDYALQSKAGPWKTRISFVADNGDNNIHQQHADLLAQQSGTKFLTNRIFIDEHPMLATPLGYRAPIINQEIRRRVDEGTLIMNFTGHGDESGWTDEQILTLADMQALKGYANMPLLVTATCEFGRYDDPGVVSGAELLTLSPRGASIGAMTTTRPVFSSSNYTINSAFYSALADGHKRLGDIIRSTKNNSLAGVLNRNFVLIGDPSMRLALPESEVNMTVEKDSISPLRVTTLRGSIAHPTNGQVATDFNGVVRLSIFDRPARFTTKGAIAPAITYEEYRTKLFEGQATVANGQFEVQFILPDEGIREIRKGIVRVYAHTHDGLTDASGQMEITLTPPTTHIEDNEAPTMNAFLNDPAFQNGQQVAPNPILNVDLRDNSGFKITHTAEQCGLTAVLDDTLNLPVSDYFFTHLDNFREATLQVPLTLESEGEHTLTITACDLSGNTARKTLQFRIAKEKSIRITEAVFYPNPFREKISYRFLHNRPGEDLEVEFKLFSKTGRQVYRQIHKRYNSEEKVEQDIDPFGTPATIKPELEIYLYELQVRSLLDMSVSRVSGKLIQQ
jgi:hypothetical protein